MAIVKEIDIRVDISGEEQLKGLNKEIAKTEKEAKKAGDGIEEVTKNGGAIAILDQLTGGLATRFRDAYEATKLFSFSLKGMRTALIATGIGALVVALGTMVVLWDEIIEAIEDVNGKLQEQIDLSIKRQDTLRLELSLIDKQIELAKKQGKANEELQKQRIALVKQLREENAEEIKKLSLQAENLKTTTLELSTREKILRATMNTLQAGSGDRFILDKQTESLQRYKEIQDLILKNKGEQIDLDTKLFELENPEVSKEDLKKVEDRRKEIKEDGSVDASLLSVREQNNAEIIAETEHQKKLNQLEIDNANIRAEVSQEESDEKIKIAKEEAEEKKRLAQSVEDLKMDLAVNGLNALQALAKEGSDFAKGVAVAQAIMNTYQGITKALAETTDPSPFQSLRFLNAALVGVVGFANVAKILNTNPTGKGASASGGGSSSVPSPTFNTVGTSGVNQLAQTLGQDQTPVQAYVVGNNVSSQNALDRNIVDSATLVE